MEAPCLEVFKIWRWVMGFRGHSGSAGGWLDNLNTVFQF